MIILEVLLGIYLTIGFFYAFYILFFGSDPWYYFFVNVAFGPLTILYIWYVTKTNKKLPFYD